MKIVITGATGYTGRCITKKLLNSKSNITTLVSNISRSNPFGNKIHIELFDFEHPNKLAQKFKGVDIFFNTYYVRFNYKKISFDKAVKNTRLLINAAKKAGVKKVVHISVVNPSKNSKFSYFRGKALIEDIIKKSGICYTILRPALLFGEGDILINNIAWMLRHYNVFFIPGNGNYKIQPIFVEDLADMAIKESKSKCNKVIDAIGPETFTYKQMVMMISKEIHSNSKIFNINSYMALLASNMVGHLVNDIILTKSELWAMKANLLFVNNKPTAKTKFSQWLKKNANKLGINYNSELKRNFQQ